MIPAVLLGIMAVTSAHAAISIGVVANGSTGYFLSSSGQALTTGGVSAGFFSVNPNWSALSSLSASQAWGSLLESGWTDLRSIAGTQPSDWSFATGGTPTGILGGTASNIPYASLPMGTRLYLIAFDGGSWGGTAGTSTFGGNEWGVVSAWGHTNSGENYASPADLGTKSLQLKSANLASSDVLVGTLNSGYATNFSVNLVPEPSTGALMLIGAFGLVAMRRMRKA